ncbi:MAG: hypothetical protein ACREFE_10420 [Limisphaerales bacterium]
MRTATNTSKVRLLTSAGLIDARVVQTDAAMLKADGRFAALPIVASRNAGLGDTVFTLGFPDPGLQGFAPKVLAHGHQVNYAPSPRPSPIGWERVSAGRVRELPRIGAGGGCQTETRQHGG